MNNPSIYGKSRLQEAIRRYESDRYRSLPEAEGPIDYSERYRKKMEKLCRKSPKICSFPKRGLRKSAAVALLTSLLLITGIFSVTATRTAVTEWFINVYESFTEIFSIRKDVPTAPNSIETVYSPTALPDGYTLADEYFAQSEVKRTWENNGDERIFFIQTPLNSKTTFDNDGAVCETLPISNVKCYLVRKNGRLCIYWNTKEYAFTLIVPETVTMEQYTDIIGSVEKYSEMQKGIEHETVLP